MLIHDGVRPLINSKLLSENIKCVKEYGSAITAGIVKETIVVVGDDLDVEQVPSRNNSRMAKAPQSFWFDEILDVHEQALADGEDNSIDSCTLMKQYGKRLHMIDESKGVFCLIVNLAKGMILLQKNRKKIDLIHSEFSKIASGNQQLKTPSNKGKRDEIMSIYRDESIECIEKRNKKDQVLKRHTSLLKNMLPQKVRRVIKRVL